MRNLYRYTLQVTRTCSRRTGRETYINEWRVGRHDVAAHLLLAVLFLAQLHRDTHLLLDGPVDPDQLLRADVDVAALAGFRALLAHHALPVVYRHFKRGAD